MFRLYLYRYIILVPIMCGCFIQFVKFAGYSLTKKRLEIWRLVQPDGMPNLHSAVFSSLAAAIGLTYGFSSMLFSFVAIYSLIIVHDTIRLKAEKGRQTDIINQIITSIDAYRDIADEGALRAPIYRPLDVMCGAAAGIACSYLLL